MGHQRTGALPDTEPWRRVVASIADGEDVAAIAAATTQAATEGLARTRADRGMAYCVRLLDAVVQAAREPDFVEALRARGLDVPLEPGVFDLTTAYTEAV